MDYLNDQGKQRTADGQTYTLAKLPMAMWVPTDDADFAHAFLASKMEEAFGPIDWGDPSDEGLYAPDLLSRYADRLGRGA